MSDALPSIILVVVLLAIVSGVKAKRGWWWWLVPFGWWIIQKEFKCPDCKGKLILADSPKGRALMHMPNRASAASAASAP